MPHALEKSDCCNSYVVGRVSVIIPTYNYGHFIRGCLDSVMRQNIADIEIIVVDDGSTDNTKEVVRSFGKRIKYIAQENAGPSAARNTGIVNSTGEWLLFLDADDLLGPGVISCQVRFLKENPQCSISVVKHVNVDESARGAVPRSFPSHWTLFRGNLDVHLCYFNIAPIHAFCFNRRVVLDSGGFEPGLHYCEDYDLLLRAAEKGFIPKYNPKGLVYYRRQSASATRNLVKLYQHDKILHWRISSLLDRNPGFPREKRVEGILALAAGTILTASRLGSLNLEGSAELLDLALKRLEEASSLARRDNKRYNLLTKLLLVRIVAHTATLQGARSKAKETIENSVRDIQTAFGAPTSRIGHLIGLLTSSLGVCREFEEERREIRDRTKNSFKSRIRTILAGWLPTR